MLTKTLMVAYRHEAEAAWRALVALDSRERDARVQTLPPQERDARLAAYSAEAEAWRTVLKQREYWQDALARAQQQEKRLHQFVERALSLREERLQDAQSLRTAPNPAPRSA